MASQTHPPDIILETEDGEYHVVMPISTAMTMPIATYPKNRSSLCAVVASFNDISLCSGRYGRWLGPNALELVDTKDAERISLQQFPRK